MASSQDLRGHTAQSVWKRSNTHQQEDFMKPTEKVVPAQAQRDPVETLASIRHLLTVARGCFDKIAALVDADPPTPTPKMGRPRLSDEEKQQRLADKVHTIVIMKNFRRFERFVSGDPALRTHVQTACAWAAKHRLVKEFQQRPPIEPTDERYTEVLEEVRKVPFQAVVAMNRAGRVVRPGPELDAAVKAAAR
jgi:hypothetical protein